MWKVLIVDDEPKIRRGFRKWVEEFGSPFKVVGECANIMEVMDIIENEGPHVFFLDIQMVHENGLDLAKKIKQKFPKAIIVIVTGYDYFEYAYEAIKINVYDFLLKPVPKTDFYKLLKRIQKDLSNEFDYGDSKIQNKKYAVIENNKKACSAIVFRVKNYIEDNYDNSELSLHKVAKLYNVNRTYLSKLMKEETGYAFTEFVMEIRIKKAKELLKEEGPQVKMYDIAKKIGYRSQHYFSRVFKNSEGISPLEFKNKNSE